MHTLNEIFKLIYINWNYFTYYIHATWHIRSSCKAGKQGKVVNCPGAQSCQNQHVAISLWIPGVHSPGNMCCHSAFCLTQCAVEPKLRKCSESCWFTQRLPLTQSLPTCVVNGNDKDCTFNSRTNQKLIIVAADLKAAWSSSETLRIKLVTQSAVRRSNRTNKCCSVDTHSNCT